MSKRNVIEDNNDNTQTNKKNRCFAVEHDGIMLPPIIPCEPTEHFNKIKQLIVDPGDVAICSYPKSGSHWLQQMIHMLKRGSIDPVRTLCFFDTFPTERIDEFETPRVWATHFRFSQIPYDFQRGYGKVIYLMRNPKDIAVSLYKFIKDMKLTDFHGSFSDFYQLFIRGEVYYSSWFDHVKSWMRVRDAHPNAQILYVYYENLKKNCYKQMKEIADFLEIDYTKEFLEDVVKACEFNSMRSLTFTYYPNMVSEVRDDGTAVVFRKGEVKDWKNWFTPEQEQEFNILFEKNMRHVKLDINYVNED